MKMMIEVRVKVTFCKIGSPHKKRTFSTSVVYFSNNNDSNEVKKELNVIRRELEEITDELVDIEDEAFGILTSRPYTQSTRENTELSAEQSVETRELTYNKYYEEYLNYKNSISRLPNATEPSLEDFNENPKKDPKIDSIGASLQEEQNNNSIQTICTLTSIIIPMTRTPWLNSKSQEAIELKRELDELKAKSDSLASKHASLVGNPVAQTEAESEGESSNGSTSRGSLLDDYADTSTEPADYMGGDD